MHEFESIKTGEKILENVSVLVKVWPGGFRRRTPVSSLSARSSAASYSSRAAVFRSTTSSHSADVFSSTVSFAVALILE